MLIDVIESFWYNREMRLSIMEGGWAEMKLQRTRNEVLAFVLKF